MNAIEPEIQNKVVKFVQELLIDEKDSGTITPALISDKIDIVLKMSPRWEEGLDRDAVTDELIRRFSLWIGRDTSLVNDSGHVAWLNSSRKKDWRYWQRYREWLERSLSYKAVESLDNSTDRILGLIEDPQREDCWDRRGLVVGHVQSGKTGNYTGLICKAADAGYKIIIVLAGLHNNLRSQTQMRLDEGFLGYETKPILDDIRIIGVGEIDGDPKIRPNFATNRTNNGDFSNAIAKNLGITPEQRPWLFVVKKNKTVLNRLFGWIKNHVANTVDKETGRPIVTNLPLLVIDDEADHASVDTGEQFIGDDGKPDPEHEPTAINSLIRQILHAFDRKAYVGYTATPFANIFIHERGETTQEGPDLFPASFIINLGAPSNYVGPARVFGVQRGDKRDGALPLVRKVSDYASVEDQGGWMPLKHKGSHIPQYEGKDTIPPSLVEAIDAFLLSCAVRHLRGQGGKHASMLIHVTRYNAVQKSITSQVESHVKFLRQRLTRGIDNQQILNRLESLWNRDFTSTTDETRASAPDLDIPEPSEWNDILAVLPDAIADIEVRTINGLAKDVLDYADHEGPALKVIAIGGDKLARGLTLEGLSVSYFLRASAMYDTLMQMGRWFGYRPGYLDVCRLYTTPELIEWFGHIADASEELREEFDLMAESGSTPKEYGLKVQSHPVLMVTSRLKMRSAKDLMLSFSGDVVETISFFRDSKILGENIEAARKLLASLGTPTESNMKRNRDGMTQSWQGHLWERVPAQKVIDFLLTYRTHPKAYKVNGQLLAEFIQSMNLDGELTDWTICLLGGRSEISESFNGINISLTERQQKGEADNDRYSIGRLLSPRDEALDLDEKEWKLALEETQKAWAADPGRLQDSKKPDLPSGPAIRRIRGLGHSEGVSPHPERGLLFLYFLDPRKAELDVGTPPVVGFGMSFPGSHSIRKVKYKVNHVLWEQEYGASY